MRNAIPLGLFVTLVGAGVVGFSACVGSDGFSSGDGDADADGGTDSDTDTDGDTDTDSDTDTDELICDLCSGDPCADGQNCVLGGFGTTDCFDASDGGQGDPCTQSTDCARTFHCMPPSNICSRWCTDSCNDCGEGAVCTLVVLEEPGEPKSPEVGRVCKLVTECDVLTREGCEEGQNCWVVRTDGLFDCGSPGAAGQGEDCRFLSDCQAGFQCDDGTCKAYCNDDGGDPQCGIGFTCVGQGFTTPGGVRIGYCE